MIEIIKKIKGVVSTKKVKDEKKRLEKAAGGEFEGGDDSDDEDDDSDFGSEYDDSDDDPLGIFGKKAMFVRRSGIELRC